MNGRIRCRKGDPFRFVATVRDGIDARYTRARFQAREDWDESLPLLLAADETNGITIDHIASTISVVIGATRTTALNVVRQPRAIAAQLRLYNPDDADDCMSFAIPVEILPEVIVDD